MSLKIPVTVSERSLLAQTPPLASAPSRLHSSPPLAAAAPSPNRGHALLLAAAHDDDVERAAHRGLARCRGAILLASPIVEGD